VFPSNRVVALDRVHRIGKLLKKTADGLHVLLEQVAAGVIYPADAVAEMTAARDAMDMSATSIEINSGKVVAGTKEFAGMGASQVAARAIMHVEAEKRRGARPRRASHRAPMADVSDALNRPGEYGVDVVAEARRSERKRQVDKNADPSSRPTKQHAKGKSKGKLKSTQAKNYALRQKVRQ